MEKAFREFIEMLQEDRKDSRNRLVLLCRKLVLVKLSLK